MRIYLNTLLVTPRFESSCQQSLGGWYVRTIVSPRWGLWHALAWTRVAALDLNFCQPKKIFEHSAIVEETGKVSSKLCAHPCVCLLRFICSCVLCLAQYTCVQYSLNPSSIEGSDMDLTCILVELWLKPIESNTVFFMKCYMVINLQSY